MVLPSLKLLKLGSLVLVEAGVAEGITVGVGAAELGDGGKGRAGDRAIGVEVLERVTGRIEATSEFVAEVLVVELSW
jgi:hypothetical protein